MTHKERMAALVEAGEKLPNEKWRRAGAVDRPSMNLGSIIPGEETTQHHRRHPGGFGAAMDERTDFACAAANARPTIALALEGMKIVAEEVRRLREAENLCACTIQRPEDVAKIINYTVVRLDDLLERWEGKE